MTCRLGGALGFADPFEGISVKAGERTRRR